MWHLTYMVQLPTYLVRWLTLCTMPRMTTSKNHPNHLKMWNGKLSTMLKSILIKFLNHHCLPLHDHFGEFLLGFAHSTKSWMVCVMWKPPKSNWMVGCSGLSTHFLVMKTKDYLGCPIWNIPSFQNKANCQCWFHDYCLPMICMVPSQFIAIFM
jgi:hypothetical protein